MGKNLKQIHIYVIHFAVHLELTPTLSINYILVKILFKESQWQFLKWRPSENLISNTASMFFSLHQGCLLSDETAHRGFQPPHEHLEATGNGGRGLPNLSNPEDHFRESRPSNPILASYLRLPRNSLQLITMSSSPSQIHLSFHFGHFSSSQTENQGPYQPLL